MHEYPPRALELIDELGIWLYPNLRLQPAFYCWLNDVAENVEFGTLADGVRLSKAAIRRLGERWH